MKHKLNVNPIEINSGGKGPVEPPEWINILPSGNPVTMDGIKYLVDDAAAKSIQDVFIARQIDMVVDYEHQTQSGQEAPAAGWIKELNWRTDGIWARVEWNPRARKYIENREYRYLSPVFWMEKSTGRVRALSEVALTNVPRINNFPPIVNKGAAMNWLDKLRQMLSLGADADEAKALSALEKTLNAGKELAEKLCTALGLEAGADTGEITTALELVVNKAGSAGQGATEVLPNKVLDALGLAAGAGEVEALGAIKGLQEGSGQLSEMKNRLVGLEQQAAQRQATDLVGAAMKAGKVTPAQKDWALKYAKNDAKGFGAYVANAPVTVPVGGLAGDPPLETGQPTDEAQVEVNKALGIDSALFAKHNPDPNKEVQK